MVTSVHLYHSKNLHTKTNESEYSLHIYHNYHQVDILLTEGWRSCNETMAVDLIHIEQCIVPIYSLFTPRHTSPTSHLSVEANFIIQVSTRYPFT